MTGGELEKEAEEYAIGLFPNDVFRQSAVIQGIIKFTEPREKRIEELDMKRKAERQIFQGIVEKKNDQLTKAKDILRMIVYWKSDKKELLNFINKAEQFLKEIEK